MSSILDALKKLESEKAEEEQPEFESGFAAEDAERELLAQTGGGAKRAAIPLTPLTLALGGGLLVFVVAAVSITVALLYAFRSTPTVEIRHVSEGGGEPVLDVPAASAMMQPASQPVNTVAAAPSAHPAAGVNAGAQPMAAPPPPLQPTPAAAAAPQPLVTPLPAGADGPVALPEATQNAALAGNTVSPAVEPPAPPAAAKTEQDVERVVERSAPEPPAVKKTERVAPPISQAAVPAAPRALPALLEGADLERLPILTHSQRSELGIPELTINFVGMPTKRQPRPSALINLKKVYVGELIPGTGATLIGVELNGIGIDVNGQRFFVPN